MNLKPFLNDLGIHSENLISLLNVLITIIVSAFIGFIVYIIAKKWLSKFIIKLAGKTTTNWDDILFDQKFFNRLGALFIPIIIRVSLNHLQWKYIYILDHILNIWIIISTVLLISSVLDGVNRIYESYPVSRDRPIKIFIQIIKIFIYCAAFLVVVHIFTEESIAALLAGLTAFAAVLMLIFKDSILGFVAGIQLSANNMIRIGDWIVMPSSGADGDVLEINLTTVKIQNWDMTITTIPTYKLVSESFTNWRGMEESEGRRIKRSIYIDVNSIHYLSESEIEALKQSALLKDYIENKEKELKEYNQQKRNLLDERRLTNIGTFREYMEVWLSNNSSINLNMTHMVRQLQSGPTGIPLEIYCFSALQSWVDYERVQSDIFDHVFAVMELFNLKSFQYSGSIIDPQ